MMSESAKKPIINCHVHVFTGDYVPPYLAKTYLPPVIHKIISLRCVIKIMRWYFTNIEPKKYQNKTIQRKRNRYLNEMRFRRSGVLGTLRFLFEAYLVLCVFFYVGNWCVDVTLDYDNWIKKGIKKALLFLDDINIILPFLKFWGQFLFTIGVLIFFKSIRNLATALLKQLKVLPGKDTVDLFLRYVQIGRFSRYLNQRDIYYKLIKQYPHDTHFIGLPMDMAFMDAGNLKSQFTIEKQLDELAQIKSKKPNTFHPFIFAEPNRFRVEGQNYFKWNPKKNITIDSGEVIELDTYGVDIDSQCSVYQYLIKDKFAGIKIYPALGYYPFDAHLLPLWKYAADHNLPIMTHCIRGTIFFRGKKIKKWDQHPIFKAGRIKEEDKTDNELDIDADYLEVVEDDRIHLNEIRNIEFCNNFTNPLNYLCLLDNKLLYEAIDLAEERKDELFQIFPSDHDKREVKKGQGLEKLKICFAHFGGDDQWKKFLESDRDNYTSQLILRSDHGIDFFNSTSGKPSPGKIAQIWKYVDWYTIICSLMLQYDNVYADISYILHDDIILPLLKQTLSNETLSEKVLYGSDFYVVRNHKSDKEILADIRAGLSNEEFDQIARINPRKYLNLP